ncbi:hypothetical protein [Candidatus Methanoperedens sp. BLZ2]|nr:hypothetical protein [Candidatus Methanoperedens sp. BLZ2]
MRNVDQLVYKLYDLTLKRSLRISIRGSKMNQKTRGSFKGKHDIIHKKSLSHRSNNLF